ncbi:hypothetical protein [Paraglaciecola sp. MB-3u-78]|uniref:hypothetical protein n=1 Tax=Paraglaciecola sp. MB-3u-78 TaxID=2058332 RepID=UPI0012FEED7D|nr:hypothetical protein [Paraglaciecola sp. MB-3u-78]
MRWLTALIILQVLVILYLVAKVTNMENSITQIQTLISYENTKTSSVTTNDYQQKSSATSMPPLIVTADFHKLLKNEFTILQKNLTKVIIRDIQTQNTPLQTTSEERLPSLEEQQIIYQQASNRIENFISQGKVSENEMWKIEEELAKLDDDGRKKIFRKLTQAVNLGQIQLTH